MNRALASLADATDDSAARRVRHELGLRGFLLSWTLDGGLWTARLTAPGVARTVCRAGETRATAIERAVDAADRIVKQRAVAGWPGPRKPGVMAV